MTVKLILVRCSLLEASTPVLKSGVRSEWRGYGQCPTPTLRVSASQSLYGVVNGLQAALDRSACLKLGFKDQILGKSAITGRMIPRIPFQLANTSTALTILPPGFLISCYDSSVPFDSAPQQTTYLKTPPIDSAYPERNRGRRGNRQWTT